MELIRRRFCGMVGLTRCRLEPVSLRVKLAFPTSQTCLRLIASSVRTQRGRSIFPRIFYHFPIAMPPKSDTAEAIVLNFVNEQNRPLNSQNVADSLQKFKLKKTSVQKALDTLADSGKISFKEYGKQKIYLARQDQFDIPNSEELSQMKEENAKLQEELVDQKKAISEVEGEIKSLQSNLTLEQIGEKEANLRKQVKEMQNKVSKLREGVTLVRPEERKVVEEMYSMKISQWRKRKRMFNDIWDTITENYPKDLKEFKEELGIEYDEEVGVSLQSLGNLLQHGKKQSRGQ